jgi:hypothetical protein
VIAAAAGNADQRLIRAQVDALTSAVLPPLRLDRRVLEQWSAFDSRTGLLPRAPDIGRAFDFTLAPSGHEPRFGDDRRGDARLPVGGDERAHHRQQFLGEEWVESAVVDAE